MQNREANPLFPGYISDADSYLRESSRPDDASYVLPKNMLFFTLKDLCTLFEKRSFFVEKSYSICLPSEKNLKWTDVPPEQSSLVGLKVRKNQN